MRELTVSQQEAIDGGWSWYGLGQAFGEVGTACDVIGFCDPAVAPEAAAAGTACDVASLECYGIGWLSSWL